MRLKRRGVLPGFGLSLGYSLLYLGLIVLLPLSALAVTAAGITAERFWAIVSDERSLAAFRLTLGASFLGAGLNAVFGLIVAWALVRYDFPGKSLVDAMVDLPFALPTAVAGIALTKVYAETGWLGSQLAALGIKVAFTPLGVIVALTFIGIPFVVRTVQPVLEEFDQDVEEAAAVLGATRLQTVRRVIVPALMPAALTGFALAFARALGEYGSVVFISGNMPMRTEIVPLLIVTKLEQYDTVGATAIATVMLAIAGAVLLVLNLFQRHARRAESL